MKRKYTATAAGLYLNYFLYGMVNIMLASHMTFLTRQLGTDEAGISMLVSAMGLGRLFTLYVSGVLSDKFGRKPFIIAASMLMAVFLAGIPLASNLTTAMILAVLAGVANALLDSGTYPALIEAYPASAGSATVLVRGVISAGATLLPLMIVFFMNHDMYYGLSFFLPAAVFMLNTIYVGCRKFPDMKPPKTEAEPLASASRNAAKPKFWHEGLCLILLGFTGPSLLYIMQLWLPTYGQQAIGLDQAEALKLFSYYNVGSLVSVAVLVVILGRLVKPVTVILLYPCISILAFLALFIIRSPLAAAMDAFVIGFSISGILQLALTVMSEFFSERKGQVTGFIYTATSLAYTVIPYLTGLLLTHLGISAVIAFAIALNTLGICLAVYVNCRYSLVFGRSKKKTNRLPIRNNSETI